MLRLSLLPSLFSTKTTSFRLSLTAISHAFNCPTLRQQRLNLLQLLRPPPTLSLKHLPSSQLWRRRLRPMTRSRPILTTQPSLLTTTLLFLFKLAPTGFWHTVNPPVTIWAVVTPGPYSHMREERGVVVRYEASDKSFTILFLCSLPSSFQVFDNDTSIDYRHKS